MAKALHPRWSSTAQAKADLIREGFELVEIVERHLAFGNQKRDFMGKGGADVLAFRPLVNLGGGIWKAVNGCTVTKGREHMREALSNPLIARWVNDWGFEFWLYVYAESSARADGDTEPMRIPYQHFKDELKEDK